MYTPAPWKFHGDAMERARDDGKTQARSWMIWAGDTETGENLFNVAEVCVPIYQGWNNEEAKANARLIAAAPLLLDVLQALVDYHATDYDEIPEVEQAIAAIKAATGE